MPAGQPPAPTRELLTRFDQLHKDRFGVAAVIVQKRDARIMADIWRARGAQTDDLMRDFFQLRDAWLDSIGYGVPQFLLRLPALVIAQPATPRVDWFADCRAKHNGACLSQHAHWTQCAIDRGQP